MTHKSTKLATVAGLIFSLPAGVAEAQLTFYTAQRQELATGVGVGVDLGIAGWPIC